MLISELSWRLILLFLPGIICTLTIDLLTIHGRWSPFDFLLRSLVFGIITYLFLQLIIFVPNGIAYICNNGSFNPTYLSIWQSLAKQETAVNFKEIASSSSLSLIVGIVVSKIMNNKWIIKIGRKFKITTKFGDDDVWSYFLSQNDVHWIWIRYPLQNIVYEGWVQSFSESEKVREIVLKDVKVYTNNNSMFLYEVPAVYLTGKAEDLLIELPPNSSQLNEK